MVEPKLQRYPLYLSGPQSRALWKELRKMPNGKTGEAVYSLAMQCQLLEAVVEKLERRVAQLERGE